jgi:hypothetical protein
VEYKEDEQVRLTFGCCVASAYLHITNIEEVWLMTMENVPQNEKTLFLEHYVQQLMDSKNIPIDMWNINKHRHWTNNAVEGMDSKLNSIIGKQQPVFLQVQKLKQEAE